MAKKITMYECERTGKAFKTADEARRSENVFPKRKIEQLKKRIASGKYWVPKVGDLVYMDTRMSIDHGEDDVRGGMAQVSRVSNGMSGGDSKCVFIEVAQHERGGNWTHFLQPDQKRLMAEFKDQIARPDPDYGG